MDEYAYEYWDTWYNTYDVAERAEHLLPFVVLIQNAAVKKDGDCEIASIIDSMLLEYEDAHNRGFRFLE